MVTFDPSLVFSFFTVNRYNYPLYRVTLLRSSVDVPSLISTPMFWQKFSVIQYADL